MKKVELPPLFVIPETDGVTEEEAEGRKRPGRVRQYSDAALFYMDPDRVHPARRRQLSSSDVLRKMNNPPLLIDYSDLKLAEQLAKKTESLSGKEEGSAEELGLRERRTESLSGMEDSLKEEVLQKESTMPIESKECCIVL